MIQRLTDTLYNVLDTNTGQWQTYTKVEEYFDGEPMEDAFCDRVIYVKYGTEYFLRNFDGFPSALWYGIIGDGTDQTAKINAALALDHVKGLKFDATSRKNIVVSGAVVVPGLKKLIFKNLCKISGAGSITGGIVECNYQEQCFDIADGLTVTGLRQPKVSGKWFGMIANAYYHDQPSATDNKPFLEAAIAAIDEKIDATVYIPSVENFQIDGLGDWYKLTTMEITRARLTIRGDFRSTVIIMDGTQLGIKLTGQYARIEQIKLMGKYGGGAEGFNSFTAHGIWCNGGNQIITDVEVLGFDGSGIQVYGDVLSSGNANLTKVIRCHCYTNGQAGVYAHGGDSNAVTLYDTDCQGNARFGAWDASFLGILVIGGHYDGNGNENSVQKSTVSYGGFYWAALQDNIGVQPGTDATKWRQVAFSSVWTTAWDIGTQYYVGCGFYQDGVNQQSVIVGAYSEGNEIGTLSAGSLSVILGGFLSSYGSSPNAIGTRNGYITANNFQAWNTTSNVGVILRGEVERFGFYDADNNLESHWHYKKAYGWTTYAEGEGPASKTMFLTSRANLDAGLSLGASFTDRIAVVGLFMGRQDAVGGYRLMGGSTTMPAGVDFGEQAIGNFYLNLGTKNNVIGWRCIAYTTTNGAGTWAPVFGTTTGTTAGRPTLAATEAGAPYFDTDLLIPIWWTGSAWVDALGAAV